MAEVYISNLILISIFLLVRSWFPQRAENYPFSDFSQGYKIHLRNTI